MSIREVSINPADADTYECDLYNYTGVFRSLNFDIRFGIVSESNLPVISSAPIEIPLNSYYVCLYGCPWMKDLSLALAEFNRIRDRIFTLVDVPAASDEFGAVQFLSGETAGHLIRCKACFERDPVKRKQLFGEAYRIYEGVILATCSKSFVSMVQSVRKGTPKAILFQPVSDMVQINPDWRRMVSHSFAGMALCTMMGEVNRNKFISLVSASICCEARRPVELASTLRILAFLMHKPRFSVPLGGNSQAVIDKIFEVADVLGMSMAVGDCVLLPALLSAGRRDLFDVELGLIIDPEKRARCERFAVSSVQRTIERQNVPAPLNTIRTHVLDGTILDRKCAACGVWDQTGKGHSRCSVCMMVYYCGRECQKGHWKEHKQVCKKK